MYDNIKNILYCENIDEAEIEVKNISNPVELHILAYNYNWDNGFRIPIAIIRNNCCDFTTAVMVFYLADGFTVLSDLENYENSPLIDWKEFMDELLAKIHEGEYGKPKIAYKIPLTKVQLFKLKKANDNILEDIISDIDGETLDIPVL